MQEFDLVVIGAGPGGYVAAIRAAQLGLKVTVVEREHLGGICLNWGCIPTKALLRTAEIKHLIDNAESFGIKVSQPEIMLDKVVERSRKISAQLAGGIKGLFKKNKIATIDGHGRLKGNSIVEITAADGKIQEIRGKNIILATGARARTIPGVDVDGEKIWVARHAMVPKSLPKSLIIVGSGAIGIEFASFYRTMDVEVTVIEMLPRILPQEDEEISQLAQKSFEKQGIKFRLNTSVDKIDTQKDGVKVVIKSDKGVETLTAEKIILAIGIVGNIDDLGLENTKIKVDRNQIKVNEWCETDEPGVYAIGDIAGAPWLAHKASHEGIICVEKIAGLKGIHPLDKLKIPGCTYSLPQIASIGLTEAKARELGKELKIGRFSSMGNGKSLALGETEGLVKTIFDAKTGELLGAHMIGSEVTELIQGFGIAKTLETTEAELMHTVFPHPTLSEMMHESVLNAYGQTIHM